VLCVTVLLSLGALLFVSTLGMVITRHLLRLLRLDGIFAPASIRVDANWGLTALFSLCFVAMVALLALLVWMSRLYRRTSN